MGNYNEKLRKVVILGPEASGKTTLFRKLSPKNFELDELSSASPYIPTENFNYQRI